MPAPNPQRRDRIADAAIAVLAEQGSRGLTHRAVDTAAAVPAGTTSRYFRTRDALVNGIIERITRRLGERVDSHVVRPLAPADLEQALVAVMTSMLTEDPHEPLALFELHLESNRSPHLRSRLTEAIRGRRDLIARQCRAAGIDVTDDDAMLLEMSVLGILFTALTTGIEDDVGESIRTAVGALLAGYRGRPAQEQAR
ncbi:TetR family transcriptional regulator [Nonomuraea sp. K274]|uniref:TetR family transcriptional regulator n=1 Tax=Nonomuraea cypriaca TaxID=1187855 RepID=A0A931A2J2_9ACTN|nr:TetR family transcriptional regulator [Nonomuraea cypriaca]MBF8185026.1 TetR family transcriptional regulator [Nonomuraea cypriaca]